MLKACFTMKIKSLYKWRGQYTHVTFVLIPPSRSAAL